MENVLGDDAALLLGTIGALMGALAAIGVVLNNNNIHLLSKDQDSICTVVKDVGAASLTAISATTSIDTDAERMAEFNKIITEINSWGNPSC